MRHIFTLFLILTSLIAFGQNSQIDNLWKLYNSRDFKSVIDNAKTFM